MADQGNVKIPVVEVGLVIKNLDPEKVYTTYQVNPVWGRDELKNAEGVDYSEEIGWFRKRNLPAKKYLDTAEELKKYFGEKSGFTLDDHIMTWFVLMESNTSAYCEIREYGAKEPFCKWTIDASGLVVDETAVAQASEAV